MLPTTAILPTKGFEFQRDTVGVCTYFYLNLQLVDNSKAMSIVDINQYNRLIKVLETCVTDTHL